MTDRPDPATRSGEGPGTAAPSPPALLRRLLDALDQPVALLGLDGRFVHLNESAVRSLAVDRDVLADRTLPELSDDPDATRELLRLWAGSTGRRPGTLVLSLAPGWTVKLRCDGSRLDEDTLVVRLRNEDDPDRLTLLSREVEAATLRELQARLRKTLGELEAANRQLAVRNAELERYAGAVAHDLRTPLYIVRGYVELLESGQVAQVDDEGRRLLAEVLRGADRMGAVIDGLLSVAKLQVTTPSSPADSGAAAQVVLDELRDEISRTDAHIELGELLAAWADPTHLVQVLSNLVGNSLKFRRPEQAPTIWISSRRIRGATEFVVEDDGNGVPERDFERIFELFDRGEAAPREPGFGIGLATCRKIVESYGGEIRCEASDRGGARFVFTIPDPNATSSASHTTRASSG